MPIKIVQLRHKVQLKVMAPHIVAMLEKCFNLLWITFASLQRFTVVQWEKLMQDGVIVSTTLR